MKHPFLLSVVFLAGTSGAFLGQDQCGALPGSGVCAHNVQQTPMQHWALAIRSDQMALPQ